jgi:hypothetical protein
MCKFGLIAGKDSPEPRIALLISTTLPIASAEPIATEKRIEDADRPSILGSIA